MPLPAVSAYRRRLSINRLPPGCGRARPTEGELGITYEDLDRYLLTGEGAPEVVKRLREMEEKSAHKRRIPPIPEN